MQTRLRLAMILILTAAASFSRSAHAEPTSTTVPPAVVAAPVKPVAVVPTPAPMGLSPVAVGPLELTPKKGIQKLTRTGNRTCVESTLWFQVRNTSAGDLRIALFMDAVVTADDSGDKLYVSVQDARYVQVGGVASAHALGNEAPTSWLDKNKAQLTTLAPNQSVTVMVRGHESGWGTPCTDDPDSSYKRTHRPKSYTLSGSLGTVDLADNASVRGFSFEEVPLDVRS